MDMELLFNRETDWFDQDKVPLDPEGTPLSQQLAQCFHIYGSNYTEKERPEKVQEVTAWCTYMTEKGWLPSGDSTVCAMMLMSNVESHCMRKREGLKQRGTTGIGLGDRQRKKQYNEVERLRCMARHMFMCRSTILQRKGEEDREKQKVGEQNSKKEEVEKGCGASALTAPAEQIAPASSGATPSSGLYPVLPQEKGGPPPYIATHQYPTFIIDGGQVSGDWEDSPPVIRRRPPATAPKPQPSRERQTRRDREPGHGALKYLVEMDLPQPRQRGREPSPTPSQAAEWRGGPSKYSDEAGGLLKAERMYEEARSQRERDRKRDQAERQSRQDKGSQQEPLGRDPTGTVSNYSPAWEDRPFPPPPPQLPLTPVGTKHPQPFRGASLSAVLLDKLTRRRAATKGDEDEGSDHDDLRQWEDQGAQRFSRRQWGLPPPAHQLPLMVTKDATGGLVGYNYTPFQFKDLDAILSRLPPIQRGGGTWLEKLMCSLQGSQLTWGDIRTVLSRVTSTSQCDQLVTQARLTRVPVDSPLTHLMLQGLLIPLKEMFPPAPCNPSDMSFECKPGEDAASFILRAEEEFAEKTGTHPAAEPSAELMFRMTIMSGLPPEVVTKLEDLPDLDSSDLSRFNCLVKHFLRKYLDKQKKNTKAEQELTKKLLCLSIQEKSDPKTKSAGRIQAPVQTHGATQQSHIVPPYASVQHPQMHDPWYPPQGPPLPWPEPTNPYDVFSYQHRNMFQGQGRGGWQRQGCGHYPFRPTGQAGQPVDYSSVQCWSCGGYGHISRGCSLNAGRNRGGRDRAAPPRGGYGRHGASFQRPPYQSQGPPGPEAGWVPPGPQGPPGPVGQYPQ